MHHDEVEGRAADLRRRRVPFVHARVVLADRPTSAKPGDEALVLADGTMVGFVGGTCAESTVRAQSLIMLDSGEPLLLRICPTEEPDQPGKLVVHNPCLSGGTLEIFLEPVRPAPLVVVAGDSPIAGALLRIGAAVGYETVAFTGEVPVDVSAMVVASHGRDEEAVLAAALRADVPYVGLVASRKRGDAVLAALDEDAATKSRVHTPAGLDLGARSPEEVAVSILAEIVAERPRPTGRPVADDSDASAAGAAVDRVCGMEVATVGTSLHLDHDGRRFWFCGTGCLRAFAADPQQYVTVRP
ncbi:MAG: xanthine dehydrogenase accessory factor [Acidimicrobiaceae bacterium]|nr:xanthine dehydrogenase accessory factor [Acidimicrobiaceae bacterium]